MRKREILLFFMMGTMMLSGCSKQTGTEHTAKHRAKHRILFCSKQWGYRNRYC